MILLYFECSRTDFGSLRLAITGAAPVPVELEFDAHRGCFVGLIELRAERTRHGRGRTYSIVTEVTDPRYIGTSLTVQLALGFVLTVFTIFLVPIIRDAHGWGWAYLLLAPGPALGWWAMRTLKGLPAEPTAADRQAAQSETAVFVSPFF